MARAALKRTTKATEMPEQKRRPGRPVGSKNRTVTAGKAKARVVASPKMNKLELEAHVVKLERTILRLREQNKELKLATAAQPKSVEPAKKSGKPAKPAKASPRSAKAVTAAPVKARRRSSKVPAQDDAPVAT